MVQENEESLSGVFASALAVQACCEDKGLPYCFIGGVAINRWGRQRITLDAYLVVLVAPGKEEQVIETLLERFPARMEDPIQFALERRVLLLHPKEGATVDVSLGMLDFEHNLVARATTFTWAPGIDLKTCSAEDLIVMKAFASRAIDWMDIEGILVKQGKRLNFDQIFDELTPLVDLKEQPEILTKLHELIDRFAR